MKVIAKKIVKRLREEDLPEQFNIYSEEFLYKVENIYYDRHSKLALVIFNSVNINDTNDCVVYKCD